MELQITFRDDTASEAVHAYVEKGAATLRHAHAHHREPPVRCRVVLEAPHRHLRHGQHYRVRIELTLPSADLVQGTFRNDESLHADVFAAIDDAFADAQRRLSEYYSGTREPPSVRPASRKGT